MRMWNVDPRLMCRRHLLGEHAETHMFLAAAQNGRNVSGYVKNGLIVPGEIISRHDELAKEMLERDYKHASPLRLEKGTKALVWILPNVKEISKEESMNELKSRCVECRRRIGK